MKFGNSAARRLRAVLPMSSAQRAAAAPALDQLVRGPRARAETSYPHGAFAHGLRKSRQRQKARGMRDPFVRFRQVHRSRGLSIGFAVSLKQQVSAKPAGSDQVRL
jgi:hypothetical protein